MHFQLLSSPVKLYFETNLQLKSHPLHPLDTTYCGQDKFKTNYTQYILYHTIYFRFRASNKGFKGFQTMRRCAMLPWAALSIIFNEKHTIKMIRTWPKIDFKQCRVVAKIIPLLPFIMPHCMIIFLFRCCCSSNNK